MTSEEVGGTKKHTGLALRGGIMPVLKCEKWLVCFKLYIKLSMQINAGLNSELVILIKKQLNPKGKG